MTDLKLSDAVVQDLLAGADDGISYDGLHVRRDESGYDLETPSVNQSGLSTEALREVIADALPWVLNWHFYTYGADTSDDARLAFLHWVERASAYDVRERMERLRESTEQNEREWGEVLIRARADEFGQRRYELRNAADADADTETLERYDDPLRARQLVKHDDDGRYRPLKTAPTLPTGWVYPDMTAEELIEVVGFVYPATIENWHREQTGKLDVTHWREAAARQTGIYDLVEELPREALDWVTEACCVDSQCLKRRRWEYDEDEAIATDPGEGEFPCREPCSLVNAAARKWTVLESESTREFTFELTLSEKNQIEAIIDAVAEGRVDEIREADLDDGANRYRARYLRAKLFEDGSLPSEDGSPDET
ncbi:DR2241 family protein [Halovenus marina]|uniref:DR2241 family protein n=1 Tax=Halovenus marina TaxID=3396621 RepID=UPI003F54323C